MRKGIIPAIVIIAALFLGQPLVMADGSSLYDFTNGGKPVKVFIGNFTNESGKSQVNPEEFKSVLKESLLNRKSVTFIVVNEPSESDLSISGIIKKFQYLERGPMKVTPSPLGIALDAAASATHNYVEMEVRFVVTDSKTKNVLWEDDMYDYKKKLMTHQESMPVIYDKVTRMFLSKSFGKPRR